MTYLEQRSSANRPGVLLTVAAIHAVGIYAVVTGLGGVVVRAIIDTPLVGESVRETVIKVDPPQPKPHDRTMQREQETVMPLPGSSLGQGPILDTGPVKPLELGPVEPIKPAEPSFAPKAAAPLGNPGGWASEADYPPGDLHAGHAGITRFRVSIGTDGRVSDCTIVASSGWPGLDAATCRAVSQRARFRAASDEHGQLAMGSFSSAIRWVIPN